MATQGKKSRQKINKKPRKDEERKNLKTRKFIKTHNRQDYEENARALAKMYYRANQTHTKGKYYYARINSSFYCLGPEIFICRR